VLTNQYDSGGLLSSAQAVKGNIVTDFVKRQEYDMFQNRRYRELGNGVHTEYTYYPGTLRLQELVTKDPNSRKLQDLNYSYDSVGNITAVANKADGPQPGLLGGQSSQNYTYDGYYRLSSAGGSAPQAPNKRRDYCYSVSYDSSGNIASKNQRDVISPATTAAPPTKCPFPVQVQSPFQDQSETTYNWKFTYKPAAVGVVTHQVDTVVDNATASVNSYSYDANGNFATLTNSKGRVQRTVTWDAANRASTINDASSSTDYLYDAQGLLGVQRGPQGEKAFVNNWFQFSNDGWFWKEIFADGDRIAQATEQVDPLTGLLTPLDYYEHQDLQGSTNVVTDQTGLVFEHMEYFPSGEIWIHENSTTHRTPYRYVGDYNDEVRNLDLLGQRWYQPREQVFYSPEPLLSSDPGMSVDDPGLLPAYTYAESNGLRLFDASGAAPGDAQSKLRNRFPNYQAVRTTVEQGGQPRVPTITVFASANPTGGKLGPDFGGHATIFLAVPAGTAEDPSRMDYRFIDIELKENDRRAFEVRVKTNTQGWPDPSTSTTWEISNDQARAALDRAEHLHENEGAYTYGYLGIGLNRYNCALIAENVLQGAGIKQSSGLIISTPLQVATGERLPRLNLGKIFSSLKQKVISLFPTRQKVREVPAIYQI
jgi:RHS repeat-associated protein